MNIDARDILTEEFITDMFSGLTDLGASFERRDSSYVFRFPEPDAFYFGVTVLNDKDVRCFSDKSGLTREMTAEDFFDKVDVISALLMQMRDGVDRGLGNVDQE